MIEKAFVGYWPAMQVANSDAHLKNLSFLILKGGIELAPHYDLLSVACYE
ncbi:HipA domain-containing protein [Paralcaligenes sp. KSB-10]